MRSTYVVSDLHIFSPRSWAHEHMDMIAAAAAKANRFVFNGDTFEFRWTIFPTVEETADQAIRWLRDFVGAFPHCQFHYVVGNHDNVGPFVERLMRLSDETPNLSWHPYFLKLGNSVFLHGDVANRKMDAADLAEYRSRWRNDAKKGPFLDSCHELAFRFDVHKAVCRLAFPRRRVARRVTAYLEAIGHGPLTGIDHVYLGHTHRTLRDYEYRGMRFHNGGAAVKGMDFRVVRARAG